MIQFSVGNFSIGSLKRHVNFISLETRIDNSVAWCAFLADAEFCDARVFMNSTLFLFHNVFATQLLKMCYYITVGALFSACVVVCCDCVENSAR